MKKRLDYFDIAKGIGVFLVLIGHLQGEEIFQYSPYILPVCEWIFSFHMPFFFIVSGMLICYKKDTLKEFNIVAKNRFKGIMLPYYWFSFFYMLVVFVAFFKKQIMVDTVLINLWYVFICYGMNVLWFLPALFFAELIFIYIMKKFNRNKAIFIVAIQCVVGLILAYILRQGNYDSTFKECAHQLAITVVRPFIACSFIAIGYFGFDFINKLFSSKKEDNENSYSRINHSFNSKEILAGIGLLILGAAFVWVNHGVDFRSMVFKNVFTYYLCSCSTSFGLILICKNIKPIRFFKFLGTNSLIFMAVHGSETVAYYATRLAMWTNQYLTRARGYICYAIIVCVITLYSCVMILLINRFVPFIAGKPLKKKQENIK